MPREARDRRMIVDDMRRDAAPERGAETFRHIAGGERVDPDIGEGRIIGEGLLAEPGAFGDDAADVRESLAVGPRPVMAGPVPAIHAEPPRDVRNTPAVHRARLESGDVSAESGGARRNVDIAKRVREASAHRREWPGQARP
jgi:hypothetical protein